MGFGYRLKYQPRNNGAVHISEQHAFWINPFQDVYPVWKNLAEDICGTLKNSCKARHFEPFTDLENCITSMNTLPLSETNIWGINSYQGNSTMYRRVHTLMAKINPEIHCPHLSWYSEEDVNGNYKCDPKYLNQIFYHWTKQELNLFEEVGKAMGLPEISLAKNVAVEDIGECISDPVSELTRAIIISDELENLDFQCYPGQPSPLLGTTFYYFSGISLVEHFLLASQCTDAELIECMSHMLSMFTLSK